MMALVYLYDTCFCMQMTLSLESEGAWGRFRSIDRWSLALIIEGKKKHVAFWGILIMEKKIGKG